MADTNYSIDRTRNLSLSLSLSLFLIYLIVFHLMARNIGALCGTLASSPSNRAIALNRNGTMDEEEYSSVSCNRRINRGV